jgi:hypothetical protein
MGMSCPCWTTTVGASQERQWEWVAHTGPQQVGRNAFASGAPCDNRRAAKSW